MSTHSQQDIFAREQVAIKICGVTDSEDAQAIIDQGADFLGFNFWPQSKRFLGEVSEHSWLRELAVCRVGVFVDAPASEIIDLWEQKWIDVAQLHGEESPEECRVLGDAGIPLIKAFGIEDEASVEAISAFAAGTVLLDAYAPIEKGGTGKSFNWELARQAIEMYPDRDIILAGGLTPGNVKAAVEAVRPAAVDVASGVALDEDPRRKDPEKVRRFIEEARCA